MQKVLKLLLERTQNQLYKLNRKTIYFYIINVNHFFFHSINEIFYYFK